MYGSMFRLRHSKMLRALTILLMVLGLFAPYAAQATTWLDEGTCHVPDGHDQPAHADHGACCVLCHAPALGAATGTLLPLPAETVNPAPALPGVIAPAPQPALAFYTARAPPAFS